MFLLATKSNLTTLSAAVMPRGCGTAGWLELLDTVKVE